MADSSAGLAETLKVDAPPRMLTPGHSKSGAVPAVVVPVAALEADAKNEENEEAGVLNTDEDEQPGRTAPKTTASAAEKPRPLNA